MKAAASLLDHSGKLQARALRQSDIDKFIGTNKGARANLARFGRWLLDARDVRVQMPRRGSSDRIAREKRLLKDVRGLMRMLNTDAEPSARQAYLALAISRLFMIPLSRVVQMEKRDFADDGDRLLLWPEDLRLSISGTLAASFRRVAANDNRYVFPGRGGHRPCSPDSIRYHWTKVEPDRFGLRGSARR